MKFIKYITNSPTRTFPLSALLLFIGVILGDSINDGVLKIYPLLSFCGVFIAAIIGMYVNYSKNKHV